MAKRVFQANNITMTATADNTALAGSTYMCVWGQTATQTVDILEVKVTGLASATSSPMSLTLARCGGTAPAGNSALASPNSDGPMHPATAALGTAVATFISCATTNPTRSNAVGDAKLDMGFNGYGGLLRWNASPTQQYTTVGSTTPGGFALLSSQANSTVSAISAHIIYEPY